MNNVFVLGCDWQRLDVIDSLQRAHVRVIGIDRDLSVRNHVERFVARSLGPEDAETSQASIETYLRESGEYDVRRTIFVDTDSALRLACRLDALSFSRFVENNLFDKHHQYLYFERAGLPIPSWVTPGQDETVVARAVFAGRAVIKPRIGFAAIGVREPVGDERINDKYLVQRAVEGKVVLIVVDISPNGDVAVLGAIQHGATFGVERPGHSAVTFAVSEPLGELAESAGRALGEYRGILLVEVIVGEDGQLHLLEITPIQPNILHRTVLGLSFEGLHSNGLLRVSSGRMGEGVRAGAFLYARDACLGNQRLNRVRLTRRSPHQWAVHAPRGSLVCDEGGARRAIGVLVVEALTASDALSGLASAACSGHVELVDGSMSELEVRGLADLGPSKFRSIYPSSHS